MVTFLRCLALGAKRRRVFLLIMLVCWLIATGAVFVSPGLGNLALTGRAVFLPFLPFIIPPFSLIVVYLDGKRANRMT